MTDHTPESTPSRSLVESGSDQPSAAVEAPPPSRHWTSAKMAEFLRHLAIRQCVSGAARAVGMSRQSAYRLRQRLRSSTFDLAWDAALQHGFDQLAQAALDRALNGVEVPHYYKGELVGTSRRYNEHLTMALLKARGPGGRTLLTRRDEDLNEALHDWDTMLQRVEDEFHSEDVEGGSEAGVSDDQV